MRNRTIDLIAIAITLAVVGLILWFRFQPMTPERCNWMPITKMTPAELKACQEFLR